MRVIALNLDQIQYDKKEVPETLKESVLRRGLAFPLKVNQIDDDHYVCIDGHKRLTILNELKEMVPDHRYLKQIPVIIQNSENVRTNDAWRGRNVH